MDTIYNTYTLTNGLRVIQHPTDNPVIYCGYAIKAGSRDEAVGDDGLAHFCEHASFKGTTHRRAWQIIQAIEGLGGELNAYTNKEATVYYCAIQREHLPKAIDVLTDMVFHSSFPDAELEKEKEVICDEIESYNDTPAELIYDDFENIIFRGHPLGHNILGTKDSVRRFTGDDARRFTGRFYRPENAVFFLEGSCTTRPTPCPSAREGSDVHSSADGSLINDGTLKSDGSLIKMINKVFAKYPVTKNSTPYFANKQSTSNISSPRGGWEGASHQAHVIMGGRGYDINHPRRLALYLLNNILGGPAMSSRLNMSLRERNGLVYTVESTMTSYGDTGQWTIYFGCDQEDVPRCQHLVRRELDRLMQQPLSDRQLQQAKRQIKGQIALSCDSHESFALDFAKSFLHYGWEKDVTALYRNIDALTASDLQQAAQELFAEDKIETLIYDGK